MKFFLPSIVTVLCAASVAAADAPTSLRVMVERHCLACHDASAKEGDLDLAGLAWQPEDRENREAWMKVYSRVERGDMPPKGEPRPAAAVRSRVLDELGQALRDPEARRQAAEGRTVYRRLNRNEYVSTLHDLLGIDTPLHDMLPEDGTAGGFDTIGAALDISPPHLERYMQAARLAIHKATVDGPRPETRTIRTDYGETWHDLIFPPFQNGPWRDSPEGFLAIRWNGYNPAKGELATWSPPVPEARYRFRIRARAMLDDDPPTPPRAATTPRGVPPRRAAATARETPPQPRIMLKVALADMPRRGVYDESRYFEMSPKEFREFDYEVRVPAGKTLWVSPYRIVPDGDDDKAMVGGICAVVEWIEITGPLYDEWPPPGHRLLYGDLPLRPSGSSSDDALRVVSDDPQTDGERLLAAFLPKAFRRPVQPSDLEPFVGLFRKQLGAGRAFDESLRATYVAALTSPQFLFRQEAPGPLDDFAVASRLSYGLCGSLPDEELLSLAAAGRLREPKVLHEQVERLLAMPQSRRFVRSFLDSWLNLRDIDFTQPDTKLYPEFEEYLQQSMVAETEAFFSELLENDLSVRNVVHSDFAMLNERLAEHYGIPGVRGDTLRRVRLPAGSHRGGLLTQGSVLKVSANGTTTSPVVRGVYVMDRMLGIPPDPPPRNIPAVEPDIRGATTIREQLAKHRDQPACASCHAKFDPLGFALESYDVTGRWRSHYRALPEGAEKKVVKIPGSDVRVYTQGLPVDPSATLADGTSFKDLDGLKRILLADPEQLAQCMAMKFVAHLTGTEVEFTDREIVDDIVATTASKDHGVRSILHAVIQSPLFLNK